MVPPERVRIDKFGRRGAPERFLAVAFGMGKVCPGSMEIVLTREVYVIATSKNNLIFS
jgi:hypothetical protein